MSELAAAQSPFVNRPIRAAIIDLDGTMVDTLDDFVAVVQATLHELGLPQVDRRFVECTIGKGSEHLVRAVLAQAGADAGLYAEAWRAYGRHHAELNGCHARTFPGVPHGLRTLRESGVTLACVTNKPTSLAVDLLRRQALLDHFAFVFGGDAFERKKPDPLPLLKCCEALRTAPARTLVIGDSSNDAQAARLAGCPVLLVTWGYNHGEPVRQVDADGFIDRLDQIGIAP